MPSSSPPVPFFLGQQEVLPPALHGSPILLVLAFSPLALMRFWLLRVRFSLVDPLQLHAPWRAED